MSTEELASNIPIEHTGKSEKAVSALIVMHTEHMQIGTSEKFNSLAELANNFYSKANYRV